MDSTDLIIPHRAFSAGLGENCIVTTLCPGGGERMRWRMVVCGPGRIDLNPPAMHQSQLNHIEAAYDLYSYQRGGVLRVAITL
ncbi:hypothetical protein [Bosea sp. (in: a-proteobacteria)]|uniref:hypothetical protein n=1 Tax=Bosea sp. (in: a-proteobacteria) TaxID=1871050 RepID=UPI0025B8FDAA|nr:hypothetical protein [Bosea sp. (in: a-proteobacteria)]